MAPAQGTPSHLLIITIGVALFAYYTRNGPSRGHEAADPYEKNVTVVRGLTGLLPPRRHAPLPTHQLPVDTLFVPGFETATACGCGLHLDPRERCLESVCDARSEREAATRAANCAYYAEQGKCRTNAQYMVKECASACAAREPCRDIKEHCDFWADEGECARNPGYMASYCPVACELCAARADPRRTCLDKFPDWQGSGDERVARPARFLARVRDGLVNDARWNATLLSAAPLVARLDGFLSPDAVAHVRDLVLERETVKHVEPTPADPFPARTAGFAWCMKTCDDDERVRDVTDAIVAATASAGVEVVEHFHFLEVDVGQQYGVHHDFTDNLHLSATGPRLFTINVFLEDLPAGGGGELWFPDLGVAVPPRAGTAVLWANVNEHDVLRADARTRHATRNVRETFPGRPSRYLEAWVHLHDFRTPHLFSCLGPHALYERRGKTNKLPFAIRANPDIEAQSAPPPAAVPDIDDLSIKAANNDGYKLDARDE